MTSEENLQLCASRLSVQLIGLCGEGAYGSVHLAYDQLGRFIVVKVVDKARLGNGWIREFNGLRAYCQKVRDQTNLIAIYHVEDCGDFFCYTMEAADNFYKGDKGKEYYRADTLALRLEHGQIFSMEDIHAIADDLLCGLEVMHQAGLIHRDVKPANVLFVNGHAKLSDMGLVASAFDTHSVAGTPGFLPPEIVKPDGNVTHNTPLGDLYALGKVIYCLLTGLSPDDFPEIPPYLLNQPLTKRLNRLLCTACNEDKGKRFQSANEFRTALQKCFAPHSSLGRRKQIAWGIACCLTVVTLLLLLNPWRKKTEAPSSDQGVISNVEGSGSSALEKASLDQTGQAGQTGQVARTSASGLPEASPGNTKTSPADQGVVSNEEGVGSPASEKASLDQTGQTGQTGQVARTLASGRPGSSPGNTQNSPADQDVVANVGTGGASASENALPARIDQAEQAQPMAGASGNGQTEPLPAGDFSPGLTYRGRSLLAKDWHSAADVPIMEDSGVPPVSQGHFNDLISFLLPSPISNLGNVQSLGLRRLRNVLTICILRQDVWLLRALIENGMDKEMPFRLLTGNQARMSGNPVPVRMSYQAPFSGNISLLHNFANRPRPSVALLAFLAENGADLNVLDENGECVLDKLLARLEKEEYAYLLPGIIYLIRCGAKSQLGIAALIKIKIPWMRDYVQKTLDSPPPLYAKRAIRQRLPRKKSSFQSNLPPIKRPKEIYRGMPLPKELIREVEVLGRQENLTGEAKVCLAIRDAVEQYGIDLNAIINIKAKELMGMTVLSYAPMRPPFVLLTFLVENGAELHNVVVDGQPFLLWVVEKYGKESWCDDMLQYLVEHGAPVSAQLLSRCFDQVRYQTLYRLYLETGPHWDENHLLAVDDGYWKNVQWEDTLLTGSLEEIRQGIEKGADVNVTLPKSKQVSLFHVLDRKNGELEAYRMLEQAGAKVDLQNENKISVVMDGESRRPPDLAMPIIRFFIEEKGFPVTDSMLRTAVEHACSKEGGMEALQYFLGLTPCPVDKSFAVVQKGKNTRLWDTLFHAASQTSMQQVAVARWLLENGYELKGKDLDKAWERTIGFWIASMDFQPRYEMVQLLAHLGPPPNYLLKSYRKEIERLRAARISDEQLKELDKAWGKKSEKKQKN